MSRRKEETPPEMLFQFLKIVPWWVGPIVIVIAFSVLRFAIPALIDAPLNYDPSTPEKAVGFGKQVLGNAGAKVSRTVAPWISLAIAALWALALIAKYRSVKTHEQKKGRSRV